MVIHMAAVSDYRPILWRDGADETLLPTAHKLSGGSGNVTIELEATPKIISALDDDLLHGAGLVGFKFTSGADPAAARAAVENLFAASVATIIVHNDASDRRSGTQKNFTLYRRDMSFTGAASATELADGLLALLDSSEGYRL